MYLSSHNRKAFQWDVLCSLLWGNYTWITPFEQRQPMSSSCARDLLLLGEHLQSATCVDVEYIAIPKLSIRQYVRWSIEEGKWLGKGGLNLFKIIVQIWLPVVSGHALCFLRHHISAVALYLTVPYTHLTSTECRRKPLVNQDQLRPFRSQEAKRKA